MKFTDKIIFSIVSLVDCLKEHLKGYDGPVWFRGQSNVNWPLIPKLLRGSEIQSESFLINRFKQNATLLLTQHPKNDFEWLFLMQHYRMPTRLLDWSESPLVAIYFTVIENIEYSGALWVLLPTALNEKSNYRPDYEYEIPSFEDEFLKNYFPETIAAEHRSKLFPIAAIAPRNSPRMQSQQSVFTISHRDKTPIEDVGAQGATRDHVWRYIIPGESKESIKKELRILGISHFQLFPELDSLALL